jgi:hypothetical protein
MSQAETKDRLIARIRELNNQHLLEELNRLLDIEQEELPETLSLTEEQRQSIQKGRQDIQEGNYLTEQQANKEIDEWLKK